MAKAVLCPVCNGAGEVKDSTREGYPLITQKSKCWGCDGKGWVEVHEEPDVYPFH